ncbi:MAG TPA: TlpA family protein disulfide reductase [Pseudomonas xinjiangensis]|uniref:TlpA family protein disulfide reductase n=2 Tax=root TaxID=1 RepID=A0A7V1BMZ7_9GAMM|nr:TlpA family protein disulfide reductase [Halopseudomonas xinjiangensis]HEC47981.1 TlpA family protein disulfide reductase [Halopseudomonas xinjiangensis]
MTRFKTALSLWVLALGISACGGEQWTDHQGNSVDREELAGRWLVVNYWADWCGPCREELPELNALAEQYPDIAVLGINFDGVTGQALQDMSDSMEIRFPVMGHDFAAAMNLPLPQVLPTTYVLSGEGAIVHTLQGPQDKAALLAVTVDE